MPRHMHPISVGTNHCISRYRFLAVSYWPGPVGLWYSPKEVCTSVARGTLTRDMSTTRKGLHGEVECTFTMRSKCQGVTPSNSKGGLPAPEAEARAQEGDVEAELTQPLVGRKACKTKQRQGIQVDSVPSQSREEPDQEASLKMEAESGDNP